jgi:hypothetical protein
MFYYYYYYYYYWNNKKHKLDLKDKIKDHKKFDKIKKNQKSKERGSNQNYYYSYWKSKIKNLMWVIKLKTIKTLLSLTKISNCFLFKNLKLNGKLHYYA